MTEQTLERRFQAAAPARLTISNICGSVHVQRGEDGAIAVTAVKHAGTGDDERTQVHIEQAADGSVVAETRFDGARSLFGSGKPCDVDYAVRVPAECQVAVRGVSSQVAVEEVSGECRVESVSGHVAARSLSGTLALKSVSGHVSAEGLAGAASVDTVSGQVRLVGCRLSSLAVNTISGNIFSQTPLAGGPYRFRSMSGNVTLDVPPQTRCRVDVTSFSGGFSTSLPASRNAQDGRRWHGTVGAPGGDTASLPQVSLDSLSGSLRLGAAPGEGEGEGEGEAMAFDFQSAPPPAPPAPPAPPPPPVPPSPVPPPPSRQEILDRVARGEMSVDEAIKALAR